MSTRFAARFGKGVIRYAVYGIIVLVIVSAFSALAHDDGDDKVEHTYAVVPNGFNHHH